MKDGCVFKWEIPTFKLEDIDGKCLRMIARKDELSGLVVLGGYDEESGKTYILTEQKE